jgi:hypothetical protein
VISAKRVLAHAWLRRAVITLTVVALPAAALPTIAGAATPGPAWLITTTSTSPTNFASGDGSGNNLYNIQIVNTGSVATDGSPITVTDFLPTGLTLNPHPTGLANFRAHDEGESVFFPCEEGPPVRCTFDTTVHPGQTLQMRVPINIAADAPPTVTNQVTVSGGGAAGASASTQTSTSLTAAAFGIQSFENSLFGVDGAAEVRAGSHPYQFRIAAQFNTNNPEGTPAENPRDITADLPAGLLVNPKATPVRCTEVQLEDTSGGGVSKCPDAAVVGVAHITLSVFGFATPSFTQPLYNMVPPQGRPSEFGFNVGGFGIVIHLLGKVRGDGEIGLSSDTLDIPQVAEMSGVSIDLWGDPSNPSHDFNRGGCAYPNGFGEICPTAHSDTPLLTMPSACSGPLSTTLTSDSWQDYGDFVSATTKTKDSVGDPVGVNGCEKLAFNPKTETQLSTSQAETGTAFDLDLNFANNGFNSFNALTESTAKKAVVTLPEGVTVNPSVGEGLGFCRPDQYKKETNFSVDGEGCPGDSKVGTLHVDTPLLDNGIEGSVYLAQQDDPGTDEPGTENPFDSDIALYLVLRNADLGVLVKQELKVEPDPKTGQLVATIDNIPQLPFSHFNFHFKEGARAALISPPTCGKYTTVAEFYPWSDPINPRIVKSDFEITKGVGGGPCPPAGVPPFHPFFEAGSLNNNAKSYSPFNMRLIRQDGEQDMTKFSSILPPGVLGRLVGVSKCPDAAIAAAKTKTGRQELASPSCPASSLIGHTQAGAGVGDSLTYVGGRLYLGEAYHGDPLSVISITPALAGPFDAGTVVVRLALTLNPETAEVEVDGANSDPIPHILKGIVLKVRDLRIHVDRPNFILNATSCDPSATQARLFGANLNVFDPSDDIPVNLSTRYQAANCMNLGFKPKLSLKLNGGAKRGDHPALRAVLNAREGDANIAKAVVTLPKSAFLDQAHIRTICTRVQFAAKNCPKGSEYGYARAWTPLLDEPIDGPVYLRSSNHKLPDLVVALHGLVDVNISSRIDSRNGGIRNSFEAVPDAPVSKFVLSLQGGKKGLVVNSRNLCAKPSRVDAKFTGQNGVPYDFHPLLKANCRGKRKGGEVKRSTPGPLSLRRKTVR